MLVLVAYGQSTSAVTQDPSGNCAVSFAGTLATFDMSPAGSWGLTSTNCSVTSQSGGITSGTFTGSLTSDVYGGRVTGTWSIAGSTQKVVASSVQFSLSISVDQGIGSAPFMGSAYQGVMSGSGSPAMFAVGTSGQINVK